MLIEGGGDLLPAGFVGNGRPRGQGRDRANNSAALHQFLPFVTPLGFEVAVGAACLLCLGNFCHDLRPNLPDGRNTITTATQGGSPGGINVS